jgi:hypothetical protein
MMSVEYGSVLRLERVVLGKNHHASPDRRQELDRIQKLDGGRFYLA